MARKQRNADEFGAWAYDARNALGLSADDVGDALGYHRIRDLGGEIVR